MVLILGLKLLRAVFLEPGPVQIPKLIYDFIVNTSSRAPMENKHFFTVFASSLESYKSRYITKN